MSTYLLPSASNVEQLLAMIFGDGTSVSAATGMEYSHHATFINADDDLVALCECDLPFVAYAGAALSMIPPGVAEDMIDEGEAGDNIVANFHEVMNICSQLLMSDETAHLKLDKTNAGNSSDFSAADSVEYEVEMPRYGSGKLRFRIS